MDGTKKQKATQADRLLLAIGVCRELPCQLAEQVTGSPSYAAALVTKLKKEGMIGCRSRDGLKGYVLHEKGRKYLIEHYPDQTEILDFDRNGIVRSEPEKRMRLHRMAYAWVWLYRAGTDLFGELSLLHPGISHTVPGKYLTAGKIKRALSKEAGGSRCCGILMLPGRAWCVYHTLSCRMKWSGKTEWTFRMRTAYFLYGGGEEERVQALFLADGMEILPVLLAGDRGIKNQLFSLDDTYEKTCLLPAIPEAILQYRLLCEEELEEKLEQLVRQAAGEDVTCLWTLDLWEIRRFASKAACRGGRGICFDYQAETLEKCVVKESLIVLDVKKVETQLERLGGNGKERK